MDKLSVTDLDLRGKRVLLRVDFNVPQNENGTIADDTRIQLALPTILYIIKEGGSVIILSHLGRPKGEFSEKYSLAPIAAHLSDLLHQSVVFISDCTGEKVQALAEQLKMGEVMMLENMRCKCAEEKPEIDRNFCNDLAKLGDVFVNDAFGSAHRKHTSTYELAKHFPNASASGLLMEREVSFFTKLLREPKRPFYALIGGAKIGTKIGVLDALLEVVDGFFIGGGMTYTFMEAQGLSIGTSICDIDHLQTASRFLASCEKKGKKCFLPEDIVIADRFDNLAAKQIAEVADGIPPGWMGMDIGPKTIQSWSILLQKISTIFWNGPMGVFEFPSFAVGTQHIAEVLSSLPATTIVGGGDSVSAIKEMGIQKKFTHISTGGGASLEFIEKGQLPGVEILTNKVVK